MSLLNIPPVSVPAVERVTNAQADTLFNYRPGTVNELADELRTPKQSFTIPVPGMSATDSPPIPPEASPADQRREASMAAGQIIDMTDSAVSFAIAFIGKRDAKNYRLSPGDKNIIRPHLAEYLKGKAVDIPPGFLLLFVVVMVYMPIIQRALADRKEAKKNTPANTGQPTPENGTDNESPQADGEYPATPLILNS